MLLNPACNFNDFFFSVFPILFPDPYSSGLGYGTQVIVTLLNFYYIVVLAWGMFYLSFSFSWDLPWSSCNNSWNTGKKDHRTSSFRSDASE